MTVCVAAISQQDVNPQVAVATDRMLTSGDLSFEGGTGKKFRLRQNIWIFWSGDSSDQLQICRLALGKVQAQQVEAVGEAANCFADAYREYRLNIYEQELLSRYGLTMADFIDKQQVMLPDIVNRIDRELWERYLPAPSYREFGCDVIIAGSDRVSAMVPEEPNRIAAHIYVVREPGVVSCHDTVGFAAVGSGARQAESYLMLEPYTADKEFPEAIMSVYFAKRSAEKSPGVGPETELMRVDTTGPGLASPTELTGIEAIYKKHVEKRQALAKESEVEIKAFMEGLDAKAKAPEPPRQAPDDNGSPNDEGDVQGSPTEGKPKV